MSQNLIIGGAGFIGCNLAAEKASKKHKVVVLDDFSRKGTKENALWLKQNYPKIKIVKADITKHFDKLKKEINKADNVYHLAAQVAVTTSVVEPRRDFEINALGSFNVVEAARQSKNNPFLLYSSTNKVYGSLEDVKVVEQKKRYSFKNLKNGVSEEQLLDFHSPYGCSKGTGDQYFLDYARIYGLNSTVFRQSCIYGQRQFGVEDQGWIAWFIIAGALKKKLTLYGNGKQVRDVLHIDDLIASFNAAEKRKTKAKGQAYNIGGGPKNTLSLLEFLELLENKHDFKIKYSFGKTRPGDQPVFISDIRKAKKELKWTPKISPEKGVEKILNWILENKKEIQKCIK